MKPYTTAQNDLEKRNCICCGVEYQPYRYNSKYCSRSCRDKIWRNHQTEEWKERQRKRICQLKRNNKVSENSKHQKYRQRLRQKISEILGDLCCICSSKRHLCCHEIHGKLHIYSLLDVLRHPQDFVRVCYTCHVSLHRVSKNPEMFIKLLKILLEQAEFTMKLYKRDHSIFTIKNNGKLE